MFEREIKKYKVLLFIALTISISILIYGSMQARQKSYNERMLECLESIEGTDYECDSCWKSVYN